VLYEGDMSDLVKLYAKAETFLNSELGKKHFRKNFPIISLENEHKVWELIANTVEANIAAFPTTYQEDQ